MLCRIHGAAIRLKVSNRQEEKMLTEEQAASAYEQATDGCRTRDVAFSVPSRAVVILVAVGRSAHAAIVVEFVPKVRHQFLAHGGVAAPAHEVTDPVSATVSPPFRVPGAREEPSPRPLEAHQPSRGVVAPSYSAELAIRSLQPRHNDPVGRRDPSSKIGHRLVRPPT
jgi:hypothetical protein